MNNLKNELIDRIADINKRELDKKIKRDIRELLHRNCNISFKDFKIYTRIKSIDSAVEKLQRKGYSSIKQMTDLIGLKVVVNNPENLMKVKNVLMEKYEIREMNDYVLKAHNNGYVGLHLNINIDSYNVEFQIKTASMNNAQEITHDNIYKANIDSELKVKLCKAIFNHYTSDDVVKYRHILKQDLKKQYRLMGKELEKTNSPELRKEFNKIEENIKAIEKEEYKFRAMTENINKKNSIDIISKITKEDLSL